jgi:hypothetical protein
MTVSEYWKNNKKLITNFKKIRLLMETLKEIKILLSIIKMPIKKIWRVISFKH